LSAVVVPQLLATRKRRRKRAEAKKNKNLKKSRNPKARRSECKIAGTVLPSHIVRVLLERLLGSGVGTNVCNCIRFHDCD
jgi:hypothetical protein